MSLAMTPLPSSWDACRLQVDNVKTAHLSVCCVYAASSLAPLITRFAGNRLLQTRCLQERQTLLQLVEMVWWRNPQFDLTVVVAKYFVWSGVIAEYSSTL